MSARWYCRILGEEMGPLPFDDLRRLARVGQLAQTDVVRRQEADQWVPAGRVIGLFAQGSAERLGASGVEAAGEPPTAAARAGRPAPRWWWRPLDRFELALLAGLLVWLVGVAVYLWSNSGSPRFPPPRGGPWPRASDGPAETSFLHTRSKLSPDIAGGGAC